MFIRVASVTFFVLDRKKRTFERVLLITSPFSRFCKDPSQKEKAHKKRSFKRLNFKVFVVWYHFAY